MTYRDGHPPAPAHARARRPRSTAAPSAAAEGRRSEAPRRPPAGGRAAASRRTGTARTTAGAGRTTATRTTATRTTATRTSSGGSGTGRPSVDGRGPAHRRTTPPGRGRDQRATTTGAAQALAAEAAPDTAPGRGRERHLEVVDRPRRRLVDGPARARALLGGGALVSVVIAFALVFLHVDMAQRQFKLDDLNTKVSAAQANYSRLRLQVAQLEAPQTIIATAEGRLGMRQPSNVTYLTPASPLPPGASTPAGAAGGTTAGGTDPVASTPGEASSGTTVAPSGDADWPRVKSQLAGQP